MVKLSVLIILLSITTSVYSKNLNHLNVIDSNDRIVGPVFDVVANQYTVAFTYDNRVLFLHFYGDRYSHFTTLYYSQQDCAGTPYIEGFSANIDDEMALVNPGNMLYLPVKGEEPVVRFFQLSLYRDGECLNGSSQYNDPARPFYPAEYHLDLDDLYTPPFRFSAP